MRRAAFLTLTALAVILEVVFAFDDNPETLPWTDYLIRLPWWVLMPVAVGFAAWLPWHLWDAKRRKES